MGDNIPLIFKLRNFSKMNTDKKELRKKLREITNKAIEIEKILNPHYDRKTSDKSINELIIKNVYNSENNRIFRTFKEWSKSGYNIIKGSKGYLIWSRPASKLLEEQGKKHDVEDSSKFYVSYIFSSEQVILSNNQLKAT